MDTKVNYALVGLFVIILGIAGIIFFFWLSTSSHNKSYVTYLVYATGGVSGLTVQSPVEYNGVRIGFVDDIRIDRVDTKLVKIFLKVEEGTPINEGTVATLIPQGITGLVYVGLQAQRSSAPPLKAKKGEEVPVIPYKIPLLIQLSEVIPTITQNLKDIAAGFKRLFTQQNTDNLRDTLQHMQHLTNVLDTQSDTIKQSLKSMNILLKNSANASEKFGGTIDQFNSMGRNINGAARDSREMITNIRTQVVPNLQEILNRLNTTSSNLDQISGDLKKNPSILVRGKQPPPKGPGE